MGKDVFDRSEGQHDEAECGVGGVEAVGPVDDEADAAIEALVPGVGSHRQMHPMPRMWLIGSWSV